MVCLKQKLWSSGRAHGSRLEGHGFDPGPMLDGSGFKAMSGSIPAPNSDSLQKIRKIQVAKWGTPKKKKEKKWSVYFQGTLFGPMLPQRGS